SSYDISPNPTLLASAVACAARAEQLDVAITVLGRSLGKTREPLKIAEEYALLDCVSGGRLIAGFPVGLSYDANLNASLPAAETPTRTGWPPCRWSPSPRPTSGPSRSTPGTSRHTTGRAWARSRTRPWRSRVTPSPPPSRACCAARARPGCSPG